MCGIAGWIGRMADEPLAQRLMAALRHRGPDAQDHRAWPGATFVHTRLSILDLSRHGAQPMANEDGSIWTVFNGEIYNHRELRHELEAKGHHFRGRSDTEILPHLYQEYGADSVHLLRGMFAFAIYDTGTNRLLLARDRFGIKPLFYAPGHERLAFASELNALRLVPEIDLEPDPQAVYDFAALFYIPAPETFFKGIRALEPGQLLEAKWESGNLEWKTRGYHSWSLAPNPALTLDLAVEQAEDLIQIAVGRQMESDVPLGSLLSGGIDSSLVSSAAQTSSSGNLRTFNVRFPDVDFDETWAALAVAEHIKSQHETLAIQSAEGTWESITSLLRHAGQPFADTSIFAVNAVCQQMKQHVVVALSGDGGDEAFGGYDFYWQIEWIARWQNLPPWVWRGAAAALQVPVQLRVIPERLLQRFREVCGADNTTVVETLSRWTREGEHRRLCRGHGLLPVRRHFEQQWDHSLPKQASRVEGLSALMTEVNFRLTLPNDYLFKVDIASMKESIEIRVPMLDEDLVEFGLTLPHRLKVHNRTGKRVLRKVAARNLPAEVATKKKLGFRFPIDRWVDDSFRKRLQEALIGKTSPLPDFFHPETYRPWVEAFCAGQQHPELSRWGLYQRIIMLLAIQQAFTVKN